MLFVIFMHPCFTVYIIIWNLCVLFGPTLRFTLRLLHISMVDGVFNMAQSPVTECFYLKDRVKSVMTIANGLQIIKLTFNEQINE